MMHARRFCLVVWSVFFLCQGVEPGFAGDDPAKGSFEKQKEAMKLYEEAYVIKEHNPKKARENLEKVVQMLPPGHVYRIKAKRLWPKISSDTYPGGDEKPAVTKAKPAKIRTKASPLPENPEVARLVKRGNKLVKADKAGEAILVFDRALKLDPADCDALVGAGVSYARLGNGSKAAEYYRIFVEKCPKDKRGPQARHALRLFEEKKEFSQ